MGDSRNPAKRADAKATSSDSTAAIAIYHVMEAGEDFETTADALFQLVKKTSIDYPLKSRHLFLDIDGHRNDAGGYDHDAYELVQEFTLGFLGQWLAEIHTPLGFFRTKGQSEDLPDNLLTFSGPPAESRDEEIQALTRELGQPIYDSENGNLIRPASKPDAE